jgi:pimeloyl-ACP methyl ester carboxylesterase
MRNNIVAPFLRKAGRILMSVVAVLLGCILVLVTVLVALSPGKAKPFMDVDGKLLTGSISEKIHVRLNGVEQGMFIRGKDLTHPVLLYLHGGIPDYFLTQRYPTGLEDYFTVVWWEQRGSGISYSADLPAETKTVEQMVSDTIAVTNYLRQRFGKEKIYLMGHSGGSFIGIQAAARAPQLYYAYIGMAQMSNQLESERLAYEYMLEQYRQSGDARMVQKLEAAPVTAAGGTPAAYLAVRDFAMHGLGIGTMHDMHSVVTGLLIPSFTFPEYTLTEKINLWRGKSQSGVSMLWDDMLATDLGAEVPELRVPVYLLEGIYDYTCSYTVAKAYFDKLNAPLKGFYTFEHSAHSPMFEEPAKVQEILQKDVLAGTNSLADKK